MSVLFIKEVFFLKFNLNKFLWLKSFKNCLGYRLWFKGYRCFLFFLFSKIFLIFMCFFVRFFFVF